MIGNKKKMKKQKLFVRKKIIEKKISMSHQDTKVIEAREKVAGSEWGELYWIQKVRGYNWRGSAKIKL